MTKPSGFFGKQLLWKRWFCSFVTFFFLTQYLGGTKHKLSNFLISGSLISNFIFWFGFSVSEFHQKIYQKRRPCYTIRISAVDQKSSKCNLCHRVKNLWRYAIFIFLCESLWRMPLWRKRRVYMDYLNDEALSGDT